MQRRQIPYVLRGAFALILLAAGANSAERNATPLPREQWAQWRGPLATGEAPEGDPPITWSETENVRWKTSIPGLGHGSPVVWNDRVFLTSAIPVGDELPPRHTRAKGAHDNIPVTRKQQYVALAIDRGNGRIVWQKVLREALPHDGGGHYTGSLASQSPVTDGQHLFVSFGSEGLYCLDWNGELVWEKDLGKMYPVHGHGEGSSPVVYDGTVLVNWDHEQDSFLVAFEAATGKERWRASRDEITSWGSPIVFEHAGRPQVVV
ncbi:MAG: PQQ-binding-like beta-propeller repeat protein, partial [Planctomycetota bacterium]|nr:PQQ-binding-like beta-propeller repeat protein [Planctomycetota bacterium]